MEYGAFSHCSKMFKSHTHITVTHTHVHVTHTHTHTHTCARAHPQGVVMEHVPGSNLQQYLEAAGGRLSEDVARFVFQQMMIAVDFCHKNGKVCLCVCVCVCDCVCACANAWSARCAWQGHHNLGWWQVQAGRN